MIVPRTVALDELLVRGVVTPHHYSTSGDNLKREAFLPPPNSKEVSLLRRQYSTDDKCKQHCKKLRIGDSVYFGLAVFLHRQVIQTNAANPNTSVVVVASPLDENGKVVEEREVFTDDPGLPMHADLLFDKPAEKGKGEVRTQQRIFAEALLEHVVFFKDSAIEQDNWSGPSLDSAFI